MDDKWLRHIALSIVLLLLLAWPASAEAQTCEAWEATLRCWAPAYTTVGDAYVDLPGGIVATRTYGPGTLSFSAATAALKVQVLGSLDGSTYDLTGITEFTVNAGATASKSVPYPTSTLKIQVKPAAAGVHGTLTARWFLSTRPSASLRDGGTITAPLLLPDGSATAPAFSFSADSALGLYRDTTNNRPGVTGLSVLGRLVLSALATPGAPTVTPTCTGGVCATTYTYRVVALSGTGVTLPGATGSTAVAHATLDSTNFNRITWAAVGGATGWKIYRTVGGATQGVIATIALGSTLTVNDTGLAGDGTSVPTANTTGQMVLPDGLTTTPSLTFSSNTDRGFLNVTHANGGLDLAVNAGSRIRLGDASLAGLSYGVGLPSLGYLGWSANTTYSPAVASSIDLVLARDAANTLAQRNGTAAQTHRVYGTFTDASNRCNAALIGSATGITLSAETAGTCADDQDVTLNPAGTGAMKVSGQANGQNIAMKSLTELVTVAAAATTATTMQIPINAVVFGVSSRVTVVIPTATTFTVTGTTSATTFHVAGGAGVSTAANTTDVGTANSPYKNGAAQTITLTMVGGVPADTTGRVRVTIHYYELTPPTS